eukprot:g491.t1
MMMLREEKWRVSSLAAATTTAAGVIVGGGLLLLYWNFAVRASWKKKEAADSADGTFTEREESVEERVKRLVKRLGSRAEQVDTEKSIVGELYEIWRHAKEESVGAADRVKECSVVANAVFEVNGLEVLQDAMQDRRNLGKEATHKCKSILQGCAVTLYDGY